MNEERPLHIVEPQAWRTSAWAILQGSLDHAAARTASFDHLFRTTWQPVYVTARQVHGLDPAPARELVLSLFMHLAAGSTRRQAAGARFRPFLKAATRDHALDQRTRPPGAPPERWLEALQAHLDDVEIRLDPQGQGERAPDEVFDHEFARCVLDEAIQRFQETCDALGQEAWREAIRFRYLTPHDRRPTLARVALELGVAEDETARILYKARQALRRQVLLAVRATLPPEEIDDPGAVEQELGILTGALRAT